MSTETTETKGNYFVAQDGGNDIMTRNNFVAQDGGNDMLKDIVLRRRRKKLSTILTLVAATATWVLMEVYQFNFLTLISWLTIFVVTSIFLYSNMLTLFGKSAPSPSSASSNTCFSIFPLSSS